MNMLDKTLWFIDSTLDLFTLFFFLSLFFCNLFFSIFFFEKLLYKNQGDGISL
jgi:hypothetical protein